MGVFVGLVHPDQPADPPRQILFVNQPLQYFSLTKPASFNQVLDQRTGPICILVGDFGSTGTLSTNQFAAAHLQKVIYTARAHRQGKVSCVLV